MGGGWLHSFELFAKNALTDRSLPELTGALQTVTKPPHKQCESGWGMCRQVVVHQPTHSTENDLGLFTTMAMFLPMGAKPGTKYLLVIFSLFSENSVVPPGKQNG